MSNMEQMAQDNRPKKVVGVIEPNTQRVLQMRRIKEEQERQLAKKRQIENKKKEDERRRMLTYERLKKNQQMEEQEKMLEEERRRMEQEEESTRLVGKFGHMINDLNTNTTNLEFTISGLDLRPTQVKVLLSNVQNNSSLKGLTMCRKKLTDVEGRQICERLQSNSYLERLELQGNNLGSETLETVAQLLAINDTIRLLDLEGNSLLKNEKGEHSAQGYQKLIEALKKNETILSINLNSTGLDSKASSKLREMMEVNTTIILLDIENNPEMDLEDVLQIQEYLLRNKQEHDDERYMEFIERKRMRREEDISGVLMLNKQTKKLRSEAIELNIKTKKEQLDTEWEEFLQKQEMQRQKDIIKMEKEAGAKKGKKKKK